MRYTFWHGRSNSFSALKWLDDAEKSLQNNSWTCPMYVDGTAWDEPASKREQAAIRLFQSLGDNTSAPSLVFQNAKLSNEMDEVFSSTVRQNKGLRTVKLRNLSTRDGLYQLPSVLFTNINLEKIDLTKVSLNLAACRQLSQLIRDSTVLSSISLDNIRGIEGEWLQCVLDAIVVSRSIKSLKFKCIEINKDCVKRALRALSFNRTIRNLDLEGLTLDSTDAVEIANLLRRNNKIKDLSLRRNNLHADALKVLVEQGLLVNDTLEGLFLSGNPLGDASGQYIAQLLQKNSTLKELCLFNTKLKEKGCMEVAKAFRYNTGLRSISLDGNQVEGCAGALLESLEQNTKLQSVLDRMAGFLASAAIDKGATSSTTAATTAPTTSTWKQVEFYLRANKANRRLLYTPTAEANNSKRLGLEHEDLPYFLEGAGTQADVFFHFFRSSIHHYAAARNTNNMLSNGLDTVTPRFLRQTANQQNGKVLSNET